MLPILDILAFSTSHIAKRRNERRPKTRPRRMRSLKPTRMRQRSRTRMGIAKPSQLKINPESSVTLSKRQQFLRLFLRTTVISFLRTFSACHRDAPQHLILGSAAHIRSITEGTKATLAFQRSTIVPIALPCDSRAAGASPPSTGNCKKRFCDKCLRRPQSIIAIAIIIIIVCLIDQG